MENLSAYLNTVNLVSFGAVFLFGVMASFTPCVYPLIPIITGVIGSSKVQSKSRNLVLSLSYVIGMALMFSALGVIAALTGRLFGEFQSSPSAHIIVGGLIIIFALSLLNVLPLPTFILNKVGVGKMGRRGAVIPVFLMGMVSGLIAAPCTSAIMGALLAYVASTQNILVGFSFLFIFAMGLGTLLIIVGTFTGILVALPTFDKWVHLFEKTIALFMVMLGCYFIFKAGVLSV